MTLSVLALVRDSFSSILLCVSFPIFKTIPSSFCLSDRASLQWQMWSNPCTQKFGWRRLVRWDGSYCFRSSQYRWVCTAHPGHTATVLQNLPATDTKRSSPGCVIHGWGYPQRQRTSRQCLYSLNSDFCIGNQSCQVIRWRYIKSESDQNLYFQGEAKRYTEHKLTQCRR